MTRTEVETVAHAVEVAASAITAIPLASRPAENAAKVASRCETGAMVWEPVAFTAAGRAWQWRAWFDGSPVGVVTWSRQDRGYLAAAMAKRIGMFPGQGGWHPGNDQSVPPSYEAVNAINYCVTDILASGRLVEQAEEAFKALRPCPETEGAKTALDQLVSAHEARYEVDEMDEDAVNAANLDVNNADAAFQAALGAVVEAAKTDEEKAAEAAEVMEKAAARIAAFNAKYAAAGRRGGVL